MNIARIIGLRSQPVAQGGNVRQQRSEKINNLVNDIAKTSAGQQALRGEINRAMGKLALEENVLASTLHIERDGDSLRLTNPKNSQSQQEFIDISAYTK